MKKLFWSLLLLPSLLWAQSKEPIKTSVYFASGASTLDKTATGALEQLASDVAQFRDFELDIQAFTDDVGNAETNKALAAKRSAAVKAFLKNKHLNPSSETVANVGEIALEAGISEEEQRRQNRRVEIIVTPFEPNNLGDIFEYFKKRDQQTLTIDNSQNQTIKCRKGLELYIPANSLETTYGDEPTGKITLSVREMHSFGDMLRANLSTQAGDKILETGGMFEIKATDEAGKTLKLKKDQTMEAGFPTQSGEGMEMFYSYREDDDLAAPIDWTTPLMAELAANKNVSIPEFFRVLKEEIVVPEDTMGVDLVLPAMPDLNNVPDANDKKAFKKFAQQMDEVYTTIADYINKIEAPKDYLTNWNSTCYKRMVAYLRYTYATVVETRDTLRNRADTSSPVFTQLSQWIRDKNISQNLALMDSLEVSVDYPFSFEVPTQRNIFGVTERIWQNIKRRFQLIPKSKRQWSQQEIMDLNEVYKVIQYRVGNKKVRKELYVYLNNTFNALFQDLAQWEDAFWELKISTKIITTGNVPQKPASFSVGVQTTLTFDRLAWINCDRFLNYQGEWIRLKIMAEHSENTQFYIIFESIRSIMSPTISGTAWVSNRLPAGYKIKIFGFRVEAQTVSYFMQSGTVESLRNTTANDFKPCKIDELQRILSEL